MTDFTFESLPKAVSTLHQELQEIKGLLLQQNTAKPEEDHLLTVPEAAEFLRLSIATVYGLIHKREIPFMKPKGGKRVYFSRKELIEYLKEGRKAPSREIEGAIGKFLNHKKG